MQQSREKQLTATFNNTPGRHVEGIVCTTRPRQCAPHDSEFAMLLNIDNTQHGACNFRQSRHGC